MVSSKQIPSDRELNLILEETKKKSFNEFVLLTLLKKTGRRIGEFMGVEKVTKECSECDFEKLVPRNKFICPKCKSIHGKEYNRHTLSKVRERGENIIKWKLGVKVDDFDSRDSSILLYVVKRRSYVKQKNYLDKETVELIEEFIRRNKLKQNDYLFRGDHFPSVRTVRRHFKKYYNKVWEEKLRSEDVPKKELSIHSLRHWLVTTLRKKGKSYEDISKMFTKHKSTSVMQNTYDHLMVEDKKDEALDLVGGL